MTSNGGKQRPAVVLVSGGLDSAVTLAIAREQGFACHALTIDYNQRHRVELAAAGRVATSLGATAHRTIGIDLRAFGGSALTADIAVPKPGTVENMAGGIPVTYVPARNTVFLSLALAWAETLCASDLFIGITLFIGVNARDYSGYPDCRPEFVRAFEQMARLATKAGVEGAPVHVHTPLIELSKAEIISRGAALGVDFSLTHSCYDPDAQGRACGACDSCVLRRKGFVEAGIPDPTVYR